MDFVHLHCHSAHSILDGLGNPDAWVKSAVKKGFKALALTDHGSCSAAYDFYKSAKEQNLIPLAGCEFYVSDDPSFRPKKGEKAIRYHLTVIAKNYNGLCSIFKQLSKANVQFYYKPLLGIDQIHGFKDCVILTGCAIGLLGHPEAAAIVQRLKETYDDDLYLEIMPHWLEGQKQVNKNAAILSDLLDIRPVATNDAHYPDVEDTLTHDVMLAIQTDKKIDEPGRFSFLGDTDGEGLDGLYLKTGQEMLYSFKPWIKEKVFDLKFLVKAFKSTLEIAEKCSGLEIPKQEFSLPKIDSEMTDEGKFLSTLILKHWKDKIPTDNQPVYLARLKFELKVLSKIGAIRYFLIVWDIIEYAKSQDILCGFGRGSVGGSLVAYLLGFTNLDPIEHGLYFERFLREDRIDMPDIDLDFAGKDRDKIIQYIKEKYGDENVCQISTVTKMHGKTAFRDVARVFNIAYSDVNKISPRIDNEMSIEDNFNVDSELIEFGKKHPDIIRHAIRLDGQVRSKGIHAGGVVITENGVVDRGVLEKRKNTTVVNWTMNECEHFGLLKIDILGLNNLSVLNDTARFVRQDTGKTLNYFKIKPNDPKVLNLFAQGFTAGFFQFESDGITKLCRRLGNIEIFETLVHINALYRPGPLESGMVEQYVKRYRKEEPVTYYHPKEQSISEETLGLPIFQEQVMRYFVDLAGFSWPEADGMRKIISKSKGIEKLEEERPHFLQGCEKTSEIPNVVADKIYSNIAKFGRYGFNKSHAACYSLIAYLTAYAKCYHPKEFMTALLQSVIGEEDQTSKYVKEAKRIGLTIVTPDINHSQENFSIYGDKIMAGFTSIKGIGTSAATSIIEARKKTGYFESFHDFISRTPRSQVKKGIIEGLANAGAFHPLEPNTAFILKNYGNIIQMKKTISVPDLSMAEKFSLKFDSMPGLIPLDSMELSASMDIDKEMLERLQGRIEECTECPFHKNCEHPIPFKFSRDNRFIVIDDLPGKNDEMKNEPLSSWGGDKLQELFKEHLDLTPGKYCKALSFCCPPPTIGLSKTDSEKIICAKTWLPELLKTTKPGVVFACGNAALKFFTGNTGIMKYAGTTFWSTKYECIVIFSIRPGMLYRDEDGTKEALFMAAINKLKTYL